MRQKPKTLKLFGMKIPKPLAEGSLASKTLKSKPLALLLAAAVLVSLVSVPLTASADTTYTYNTPAASATVNGVVATVTSSPSSPQAAGTSIIWTFTYIGTATAGGVFLMDLSSSTLVDDGLDRYINVRAGETPVQAFHWFTMPSQNVNDWTLTFTFKNDTTIVGEVKGIINTLSPVATLAVNGGAGASAGAKSAAIASYLLNLPRLFEYQGTSITAAPDPADNTKWAITISRDSGVTDTVDFYVLGWTDRGSGGGGGDGGGDSAPAPPPFTSTKNEPEEKAVDVFYMGLLGRGPDPEGFAFWVEKIESGEMTFAQVSYAIIFSEEVKAQNLDNDQFITRLYNGILGRMPDAEGLDFWIARLGAGASREAVFAAFAASPEFAGRMQALGLKV